MLETLIAKATEHMEKAVKAQRRANDWAEECGVPLPFEIADESTTRPAGGRMTICADQFGNASTPSGAAREYLEMRGPRLGATPVALAGRHDSRQDWSAMAFDFELIKTIATFLTGGAAVGLINRYWSRRDKHEDLRVTAYREVLSALGDLRAAFDRLDATFDFGQERHQPEFQPTLEMQAKAGDLIERRRGDTGERFANAGRAIVDYYDKTSTEMWEGDYHAPEILPSLKDLREALYDSIPEIYRVKVAPGLFEERAARSKNPSKVIKPVFEPAAISAGTESEAASTAPLEKLSTKQ